MRLGAWSYCTLPRMSSHYLAYLKGELANQQLGRRSKYVLIGTATGPLTSMYTRRWKLAEETVAGRAVAPAVVLHYVCSDIYKEEEIGVCYSCLVLCQIWQSILQPPICSVSISLFPHTASPSLHSTLFFGWTVPIVR